MSILSELDYTKKPYTTSRGLCDISDRVQIRSNMMIIVGAKKTAREGCRACVWNRRRERETETL